VGWPRPYLLLPRPRYGDAAGRRAPRRPTEPPPPDLVAAQPRALRCRLSRQAAAAGRSGGLAAMTKTLAEIRDSWEAAASLDRDADGLRPTPGDQRLQEPAGAP